MSKRLWLICAIGAFVATRLITATAVHRPYTDLKLYFMYAAQGVDAGATPYKDFSIEYPPIGYWLIALPRVFRTAPVVEADKVGAAAAVSSKTFAVGQGRPWPAAPGERFFTIDSVQRGYQSYVRIFRQVLSLVDIGVALCVFLLALRLSGRQNTAAAAVAAYSLATFALSHVLWDRLDLFVALLIMGSLLAWLRGCDSKQVRWLALAVALTGLGVGLKLFTGVMIPFFLLGAYRHSKRAFSICCTTAAVAVIAPFAIQYAVSGPDTFAFFRYHGERSIQIESTYASLEALLSFAGLPIKLGFSHGSTDLLSPISGALQVLSPILLLSALGALGLYACLRLRRPEQACAYAAVAVLVALAFSKVLSVQFFLFAVPVLLVLSSTLDRRPRLLAICAIVVVALLSAAIFPYLWNAAPSFYPALVRYSFNPHLNRLALLVLIARNTLFLLLTAALVRQLGTGAGSGSSAVPRCRLLVLGNAVLSKQIPELTDQ